MKRIDHPDVGMLALFAGRDLPWTRRIRIHHHIRACSACEEQIKAMRASWLELRHEAESETLTSFEAIADWARLEREMVGNIGVGLAAARCVDPVHKRSRILIPGTFVTALLLVFALGWATHVPTEQTQHIVSSVRSWWGGEVQQTGGTVLRSSPNGIAVRSQGTTLTLMHPRSATVSVSGGSAVEARFIDETTGQVTITSVYGQ